MQPVLVLQHSPEVPPGYVAEVFSQEGIAFDVVRLDLGAPVPTVDGWSGIVSLGGIMGAYDEDAYQFLVAEKALLRDAVHHDLPVLGICLGCQMLADALGGRAYKAPQPEVGLIRMEMLGAERDPVIAALDGPTLTWHQDTWEPPPGARVLAVSDRYRQAFRLGTALGIQPHPEATPEIAIGWSQTEHGAAELAALSVDRDALIETIEALRPDMERRAGLAFRAWLSEVVAAETLRGRAR